MQSLSPRQTRLETLDSSCEVVLALVEYRLILEDFEYPISSFELIFAVEEVREACGVKVGLRPLSFE